MQENEIRCILAQVIGELDLRARARRAAGALVGTSLLVTGSCGGEFTPAPTDGGAGGADGRGRDAGAVEDASDDGGTITPVYSVSQPDSGRDIDSGPAPEYMAQFDGGATTVYMAPTS